MELFDVIQTKSALKLFTIYLEKEQNDENIRFYLIAAEFAFNFKADSEVLLRAKRIYDGYIKVGAKNEVNISDKSRKQILKAVNETTVKINLFADAKDEIYHLMETDAYPRFNRSPLFKTYLALAKN